MRGKVWKVLPGTGVALFVDEGRGIQRGNISRFLHEHAVFPYQAGGCLRQA